ncbi:NADH-quinone oxidoreductase subunit M [Parvularcula lutaonensis]|uniref:NADH-quinone oxidoreductase subunit M n=1 Tax=Parvularcula lutaonensis TaxID=491923 RepID=A0ABV7M8V9_9PROT|nr:NADH-quinone oxidoreductase subunit M [Parvularcula lutaonensis]GGY43060.1 NADH-quinone oxidoreductase subunit M [Parvularcula lutaonensis]
MPESTSAIPWLSLITFLPLVGAALIIFNGRIRSDSDEEQAANAARWVSLVTTGAVFLMTTFVYFVLFDPQQEGFQLVEQANWLGNGIAYKVGVDGISVLFVLLTAFIMPICILASWTSITSRVGDFMVAFLVLETAIMGVFTALDLVLFYVYFEASLIPMFLIIGIWGSPGTREIFGRTVSNRVYAAFKFFLYTLLGSLLMLIALIYIYLTVGTTDIPTLLQTDFGFEAQKWLWLAFFVSFAVKMPMWPVHTWLPDAHVQAPTGGSIVLAAILLKMGGYGFIRFSLPMFPDASVYFSGLVFALSVIAIIYTSLVAFAQEDMKKLIAYSSVAHMGFVTMGLFTGTQQGIDGAMFQMLSHGFISGALFLCVGILYERRHTREIAAFGGLAKSMKVFAFFFLFFSMANVGLPGLSGFIGEILTMIGAFQINTWVAALAALGMIFSAAYGLRLYREVVFDPPRNDDPTTPDLNRRELGMLAVLGFMTLYLGVRPTPTLDVFAVPTAPISAEILEAVERRNAQLAARRGEEQFAGAEETDPASTNEAH